MPTIDIDIIEFERLLGVKYNGDMEKLGEALAFVKAEVKLFDPQEGVLSIELKDTNRPDLWSVEGLARGMRSYIGLERGLRKYVVGDPIAEVIVNPKLENIRPFICCSIVKDLNLTDTIIRGLMHLQDKLDKTYGRNRHKTSIGIYDFDLISMPLDYTVAKPDEISFVPLGFEEKMNLDEILEKHPKGQEYGHIVKKHEAYPILLDADRKVLSFPPIINSNDLGKITEKTRNLLIEVTGTLHKTVLNTLNLVTMALIDRGGKPFTTTNKYVDQNKEIITPDFGLSQMRLDVEYANQILGLHLSGEHMAELFLTAGLGVEAADWKKVDVIIPSYRVDVMHPIDLVEDVAIAYGYNNIEPLWRDLPTTGGSRKEQRKLDKARDLMVGLGYQEILTYTLSNPETLFTKMNRESSQVVEIANPKVATMTCLRNWMLPGLMEFLSNNQSVEFPQKIFELGKITLIDDTQETKTIDREFLAAAISHPTSGFSEIKSVLDAFLMNMGCEWKIKPIHHPSYMEGRTGLVIVEGKEIGIIGEINPLVLEAWKLENPTAAFEISMQSLLP